MKTILVTGGAGFIGSHICEILVKQGHFVICLDNFFTGRKKNIQHLLDYNNFELIRHDIVDPIKLEVQEIYNLACPASPVHYQYNAIKTIKTSILGTMNMLGLAKRVKAKILQASTSEVYGDPTVHPQPEDYRGNVNPIGPRACYDEGKRVAETLCFDYYRQHGVEIRVVRIFNTYGPNMQMDDGRVVSNFIVQALKNQDITVYGDGTQTRSFCYVSDLVKGMIDFMNQNEFVGPLNLGNDEEFKIIDLAKKVIELTNSSSKVVFKPLPEDDPLQRKPDLTLARKIINYEPKIKLTEGLIKTIEYFRERIYAENSRS
ncbi:MAG: UDP-glucuronic acid decarboxylase family protein [Leptonema sp. (in: bacteria)]